MATSTLIFLRINKTNKSLLHGIKCEEETKIKKDWTSILAVTAMLSVVFISLSILNNNK
jgi:hypothetical protein